jgi:hypothetical protein
MAVVGVVGKRDSILIGSEKWVNITLIPSHTHTHTRTHNRTSTGVVHVGSSRHHACVHAQRWHNTRDGLVLPRSGSKRKDRLPTW